MSADQVAAFAAVELAAVARAGGAVIFPTDTLPALAALPAHADQIWRLKQRPRDKPLILMAARQEDLQVATGGAWRPEWLAMAARVWPGAVTLVLPACGPVAEALHPGGGSLGLRIPAAARALELLDFSGPLATTSANRSGEPACRDAAEAAIRFPAVPQLAPRPWVGGSGEASTVLAWGTGGWRTLRAGASLPLPPVHE
ncbi:MAG: Sua5/YciO/YrdC/YwlC family protein [Cyanobacteriota bacterium]|nr:Sua5/YciO/YrdC/YwlC family protein [Cyanobacteriota bacterium]